MSLQLIYESIAGASDEQDPLWRDPFAWEAKAMIAAGIAAATSPSSEASCLIYRGGLLSEDDYPRDPRFLGTPQIFARYLYIRNWYPIISDLTIETFFVEALDDAAIREIKLRGWNKAFVKDSAKSAVYESVDQSVWPTSSMADIEAVLRRWPHKGGFSIRKYLEPLHFEEERRYWVMNGNVYVSGGVVPSIVQEAADRLYGLGGNLFTIDATPSLIVEVNPGEASDRKVNNSEVEFIAWIIAEFGGAG